MARLHFTVALLALAIAGACGGIVDRGSLHAAMLEGLNSHPTMRQVTVYDPQKAIIRWRLGPSPPRCDWRMTAHIVGDYAVDETQISMKSDNCSEYTTQHWSGTFLTGPSPRRSGERNLALRLHDCRSRKHRASTETPTVQQKRHGDTFRSRANSTKPGGFRVSESRTDVRGVLRVWRDCIVLV